MASVKGEDEIAFFEREIEEFCTELQSIVSEQITQSRALRDSCREFIKALSEKWSKKLREMDLMIDKIQEYSNEMLQLNQCILENEGHLTETKSMLNQEKQQNKDLTDSVQEIKEQMKKETSNPKSIEERKEQLCKLKTFYEERLGLEIRRTHNEQLQFIFRHIDHKEPDKPFVCTFSINEQGDYEGLYMAGIGLKPTKMVQWSSAISAVTCVTDAALTSSKTEPGIPKSSHSMLNNANCY